MSRVPALWEPLRRLPPASRRPLPSRGGGRRCRRCPGLSAAGGSAPGARGAGGRGAGGGTPVCRGSAPEPQAHSIVTAPPVACWFSHGIPPPPLSGAPTLEAEPPPFQPLHLRAPGTWPPWTWFPGGCDEGGGRREGAGGLVGALSLYSGLEDAGASLTLTYCMCPCRYQRRFLSLLIQIVID